MLLKRALSFFGSAPDFGLGGMGAGGDKPPPDGNAMPTLNLEPQAKKPKNQDVAEAEYPEDKAEKEATEPPWRGHAMPTPAPPSGGYSYVAGAWMPAPSESAGATAGASGASDSGPHTGAPASHIDLRQCHKCGEWSYLRKGACCTSQCVPLLH